MQRDVHRRLAPGRPARRSPDRTATGGARRRGRCRRPGRSPRVPLPWWTSKSTIATRSRPSRSCAARAAIATLLKRQKPIARAGEGVVAGRAHEREAAAQRRLDRRARRERGGLERRRRADSVAVEPETVLDRADELHVLGRVAEQQLVDRRRAALAPDVLVGEQHLEPFGSLRMPAGRVQPRHCGVRQDVDSAATRLATPPSPRPSRKEDASAHAGDVSARGGRGAEASIVAIRRKSLKSSASAGETSVGERSLERAVLPEHLGGLLRPDAARSRQLVGRVAAQRDQVRHLLRARRRSARAPRPARSARARSRRGSAAGS